IAGILGAPLILQPYSRLVVDCNRPTVSEEAIPEISDGVEVPGNTDLSIRQRQQRFSEIFDPFHRTVSEVIDRHPRKLVIAIHSFTPVMAGVTRPWDIGFLYRQDSETSRFLAETIHGIDAGLKIGMNEPYAIDEASDWFVPHHGERRGIAHSLIEIRNDHLGTKQGCNRFADLLCQAINGFLEQQP
ncbi:MAG: N-formylglutamate amidohydrolase, partial [Pseudomonadota bacterium]